MVKCAKYSYENFHTVVNALKESGITYTNSKKSYAEMDNKFSKSRLGIGWSSNMAMLALTYYWTELQKDEPDQQVLNELHDNFIILAVVAQLVIDSSKREYEIDGMEEIKRIQRTSCMNRTKTVEENGKPKVVKFDFPIFMKYTREIPVTKDGKELAQEIIESSRDKLNRRIDESLICPMNWLNEWLSKIQGSSQSETVPAKDFFIKMEGNASRRIINKIMSIIVDYDNFIIATNKSSMSIDDKAEAIVNKTKEVIDTISKIRIGNIVTINRLIETALGLSSERGLSKNRKYNPTKYTRKILNILYKTNKDKFLMNFSGE